SARKTPAESLPQARLAEEPARTDEQHHGHDDEDHDLGEPGSEKRRETDDLADEQTRDDGPGQAAHAPDHHHHEAVDDDLHAHLGVDPAHGSREHAGQASQADPDPEDQQPDPVEVEAQGADHEGVS